jgi:uncharacterized protein
MLPPATTKDGWFGMPDMAVVDNHGRLWIGTDGNNHKATGRSDGLWALETGGDLRGLSKHFFRCPVGAELCGPTFTPDDRGSMAKCGRWGWSAMVSADRLAL